MNEPGEDDEAVEDRGNYNDGDAEGVDKPEGEDEADDYYGEDYYGEYDAEYGQEG